MGAVWSTRVCAAYFIMGRIAAQDAVYSSGTACSEGRYLAHSACCYHHGILHYDQSTYLPCSRSYWTVDILHRSNCLVPDGYTANDVEGCKVFFSVCQAVPYLVCQGHANSAICMEVATTNGSFYYYNFGDYQVDDEFMPLSMYNVESVCTHDPLLNNNYIYGWTSVYQMTSYYIYR